MKKLITILLILCCCVLSISCKTGKVERDRSLTGSISYSYQAKIECTFDGVLLTPGVAGYDPGWCEIRKVSDTKVSFYADYTIWGGEMFIIAIPELPVSGKPYDIVFDYVSQDGRVLYDDDYHVEEGADTEYEEYDSVITSIKGWMKEETGAWALTREIACPNFDCDISIDCTIDGKELNLKIAKLEGR